MAPATFAGATNHVRENGRGGWDRDAIIQAIQEWVALHGEPPRAADWNPSSAKWAGQTWRVERYRAGRPDGSPWPALNTAKRPFGGSLNEAVMAAGFQPAKPGPKRRTGVTPEQADRVQMDADGRAMLDAALAEKRAADRRLVRLEGRLERARDRATRLTAERDAARKSTRPVKPKVERVVDAAAVTRARKRADAAVAKAELATLEARERAESARAVASEARATAAKLAARSERSEATVATLRGERRELKDELARAADRVTALERMLADARAVRVTAPPVVLREEAPEAAVVREAQAEAVRSRRAAEAAELRAAAAERELGETVAAVRGETRRLTPAELNELRAAGPGGPAVLAAALQALTAARRTQNPTAMATALAQVAQAAVSWQERI